METQLSTIDDTFQSGKHKEAIAEIQTLIETYPKDDGIYKAYDHLAGYFNLMGQHVEAVDAWTKALQSLEDVAGSVNNLRETKMIDWMNISLQVARVSHRQGAEGSGLNNSEEAEWKQQRFQTAIKHYRAVLAKLPESGSDIKKTIRTELIQVLFDADNIEEAVQMYEDAFKNDGDAEWLYKAADCLWQQGKTEQAYTRLQQLMSTEPTFAKAYKLSATYLTEQNETAKAEECTRQYQFYSWVPKFCQNIEYNPENVSLIETINSDKGLDCVQTILATDTSKRSTEFLAAISYHHYHGPIENKAFEVLEKRGKAAEGEERNFVGTILMLLLKKHQSICTIKGAASALAGMKYDQAFEILERLLPQDVNLLYPMHIPTALAKLGDPRAVPLLIKMVEEPVAVENDEESDSSDECSASGGSSRLVNESCLALASFYPDERVKEVLVKGTNNEQTREVCLAALSVSTGEKQYLDEIEKLITEGNTLDYMVAKYFRDHAGQSEGVDKLLKLSDEVYKKKQKQKSDDEDD